MTNEKWMKDDLATDGSSPYNLRITRKHRGRSILRAIWWPSENTRRRIQSCGNPLSRKASSSTFRSAVKHRQDLTKWLVSRAAHAVCEVFWQCYPAIVCKAVFPVCCENEHGPNSINGASRCRMNYLVAVSRTSVALPECSEAIRRRCHLESISETPFSFSSPTFLWKFSLSSCPMKPARG